MWMLKDTAGSFRYLKPNKPIKVGRKDADIILENDTSISRNHALITVTLKEQVQTSEKSSTCLIKDSNSKYGSFVVRNDTKLKVSKEGLELHHGDTLTFGLQNCTYSVEYIHFLTVISRLSTDHKEKLKSIMDEIGGLIIDSYNIHCTHVTATTASFTSKIISSLIAGIPIVGINYWIQVRKCIEENKVLPDPNRFTLPLQDAGVNLQKVSLIPNSARKTLFHEKTFIFFSDKSFKEYREMIQQAGGSIKVYPMSSSFPDDLFLDNNIVMKITTNDSTAEELIEFDALLQNKMKEKNLRAVNETEIPLAVIYASLDQYCNPKYNFAKLLRRKSHVEDTSEVLALDTQDITCASSNKNAKCKVSKPDVAETNDIQNNSSQSQKCLLNQDPQVINTSEQVRHFQTPDKKSVESTDDHNKIPVQMKEAFGKESNEKIKSSGSNLFKPINSSNSKEDKEACSIPPNNDDVCDKRRIKSNKRQRETSESDEMNENIQHFWPNKKRSPIEVSKTKTVSRDTENADILPKKSESQVTETNDKKNKADKWGFKKSNKRVIDFDLDDMDVGEFKKIAKRSKNDVSDSSTKEFSKNFDLDDIDENESKKLIKKSKFDLSVSSTRELPKTESLTRNKKAETILEPEKDEVEIKQNIQLKIKPIDMPNKKSHFKSSNDYRNEDKIDQGKNVVNKTPSVMSFKSEVNVDNLRCGKIFKKLHNQIPATRVPLADMTIWRPN